MKKIIFLIILVTFTACKSTTTAPVMLDYHKEYPKINEIKYASMGSVFYFDEYMKGQRFLHHTDILYGRSKRIELSVASAGENKFSLYFKSYIKKTFLDRYGYRTFEENDPWMIQPGFTQKFDYEIAKSKVFSFKDLKFEILGISDGGIIKYKRIK